MKRYFRTTLKKVATLVPARYRTRQEQQEHKRTKMNPQDMIERLQNNIDDSRSDTAGMT